MTAQDFIKWWNPNVSLPVKHNWHAVKQQAIRHTRGDGIRELLSIQRPNESAFIREYRMANIRLVTQEGTVKFNDKAARIINGSNFTIANRSQELTEWMLNTSFPLENGDTVHFREYFTQFVLPSSFEDPNALLLAFPFNPENPEIPPAFPPSEGGLLPNTQVSIRTQVIESDLVVWVDDDVFSWEAGVWSFMAEGKDRTAPFFFIVDKEWFYRYIPVGFNQDDKGRNTIKYELQPWYFHDTGKDDENQLPVNLLGGTLVKDSTGGTYYDSFLKPYYENGDEAMTTLSDYQAVKVRNAYPTRVLQKTPCSECDGDGKVRVKTDKGHALEPCNACSGKGYMQDLSPFKDLVVDADGGLGSENQSNRPIIEYVSPPLDSAVFLKQDWQDWLTAAKQSINLDVLLDVQESGTAKEHRLTDLRDMLMKIGNNIFDVMEHYLWFVECLLQPNRNQRQRPVIIRPTSYKVKTAEMLMTEANQAAPSDRQTALMEFFKRKYAGNDEMIRIKELALQYAPLLMINDPQELSLLIASGAYGDSDIVKRDRVQSALEKVAKTLDIMQADEAVIFAAVDEILAPALGIQSVPLVGADGSLEGVEGTPIADELAKVEAESQAKLRGTVGGVTGIIQITQAVAAGTLSQAAAEKLLIEIYGFNQDVARGIIDVPDRPNGE